MGPDLLGILGACTFIAMVLAVFGALDRLISGACGILFGAPGLGLEAGFAAWAREGGTRRRAGSSPSGPDSQPPEPVEATATEPIRPVLRPGGGREARFGIA
jgi:hypothetical protein